MKLNSEQEKAVHTVEGRLLVLAGAGSGKTRVIVNRIAYLIQELGVSPSAIMGLTFTNKAAGEMRERVQKLIGTERGKEVTLSTFHSFCMQVLRRYIHKLGYTNQFSLYDEKDLHRLVNQLAKDLLNCQELPSLGPTMAVIQDAINQGISEQDVDKIAWPDSFSKELYIRLQGMLRAYNAVTFDHLLSLTIRLFTEHPDVLRQYQDRYRYLMIDEYQDTNHAQFRLAELLAARSNNLCVVGDDDQSIYGWRGAHVSHILNFRADHTVRLEQNYRSSPNILAMANKVIQNNKQRHNKVLWSSKSHSDPIEIFNATSDIEEAQAIVRRILKLREEQELKFRDMAILYRSNALSRIVETTLLQTPWHDGERWLRGIPYEIFGGLEFSARSEIKDLLSFLRTISNPNDQEGLLRILNVPRRGISDLVVDELSQISRTQNIPLWQILKEIAADRRPLPNHPRAIKGVKSFVDLISAAANRFSSKAPLSESLTWFIEAVNYRKAIEEETKSEEARLFKWENAQEFVNSLAQYEQDTPEADRSLAHFIAETMLFYQPPRIEGKPRSTDRVQLMTFHSAKGLEFPACFLIGLEEGILPHEKSMLQTGVEEERRLFYVGITRACKFLILSMARSRMRYGHTGPSAPSPFLKELPQELLTPVRP